MAFHRIQNVLRMISRLKTRDPGPDFAKAEPARTGGRALHLPRNMAAAFVAVDCDRSSPADRSELFGYEKGAFTGALRSKQGLLQSAIPVLFYSTRSATALECSQAVRFLEEKEVRRG